MTIVDERMPPGRRLSYLREFWAPNPPDSMPENTAPKEEHWMFWAREDINWLLDYIEENKHGV